MVESSRWLTKSYGLHVQADAILQASTGFDFAPDAGAHGYRIGVDHTTGVTVYVSTTAPAMMNAMTLRHEEYKQKMMSAEAGPSLQGWKGFQFAHFVRPTDIFYPKLWSNASLALGGIWVPSYWVRSRFEPADPVAAAFKFGLSVSRSRAPPSVMTARHS